MTEPYFETTGVTLWHGDCIDVMRTLPDASAQCAVTSPPYFGLRDYGVPGQIGAEASPDEYVQALRAVFDEVRRLVATDGTLWLNLGDSYYSGRGNPGPNAADSKQPARRGWTRSLDRPGQSWAKPKSLLGMPWRVALALQDDGWTLRNAIVWHKTNAMPDPTRDRFAGQYEHVFLLSKSRRYYCTPVARGDVWSIPTRPYRGAHCAVMPPELARRCILSGSRLGDTVLDPFSGAGTTALVALDNDRRAVGIEMSADYLALTADRLAKRSAA